MPSPRSDARRAYEKRWREENRAAVAAKLRKWRSSDKGRAWSEAYRPIKSAKQRAWHLSNLELSRSRKVAVMAARRSAAPMDEEAKQYVRIIRQDPCSYCGGPGGVVDHIVPLSRGGTNDWENLTSACASCNARKHVKSLLTFIGGD